MQLLAEAATSINWREGLAEVADEQRDVANDVTSEDGIISCLQGLVLEGKWRDGLLPASLSALMGVPPERQDRSWSTRLGLAVRNVGGRMERRGRENIRLYFPPVE
jgi:hypothetical protein